MSDPIDDAFKALHQGNLLAAKDARIKQLEAEVERLTAFTTRTIIPNELLKAEVERLKNNCDYLDTKLDEELEKSAMLCGQVERLTKAGDAMAVALNLNDDVFDNHEKKLAQSAWNDAKEGKQSNG
jgi:predicted RNase H-like nuclease (RuvC/YqgF family)